MIRINLLASRREVHRYESLGCFVVFGGLRPEQALPFEIEIRCSAVMLDTARKVPPKRHVDELGRVGR